MRILALVVMVAVSCFSTAWGDAGVDAYVAFRSGASSRAVEISSAAAEAGDYAAQFVMGMAHHNGKGATKDKELARAWFEKAFAQVQPAADGGDARAQAFIGLILDPSAGFREDMPAALAWVRKSAEAGNPLAQNRLGEFYAYGLQDGGYELFSRDRVNLKAAINWYSKAAEQGNPIAQYNLGQLYGSHGALPDADKETIAWYTKAAEQGYAAAQEALGRIYSGGAHGVKLDSSIAFDWFKKAADQDVPSAQYQAGQRYKEGLGVAKNPARAAELLCKAAPFDSMAAAGCRALTTAKAREEATAKRDTKLAPKREEISRTKRQRQFRSYKEAREFFKDGIWLDEQWALSMEGGDKFDRLVYVNPLRYRGTGKVIETLLVINQVVSKNALMLKPLISDQGTVPVYYGTINENFLGPRSFSDDKPYVVIAEVVGEARYTDRRGFDRKAPKLFLYAIAPYGQ